MNNADKNFQKNLAVTGRPEDVKHLYVRRRGEFQWLMRRGCKERKKVALAAWNSVCHKVFITTQHPSWFTGPLASPIFFNKSTRPDQKYTVATRRHGKRRHANNPVYPAPIDVSHQHSLKMCLNRMSIAYRPTDDYDEIHGWTIAVWVTDGSSVTVTHQLGTSKGDHRREEGVLTNDPSATRCYYLHGRKKREAGTEHRPRANAYRAGIDLVYAPRRTRR
ncbi:hypothetical protein EVAR_2716_1 [Eumeta japonica]|uniref:Uncharacterized protein n=1 Tax=Eumeta variegata TaxID=151549 RepID=A0A4C1SMD4_EUMVA|nr:hypothetical protein EVAR_2716_1 [Eumeta japonica]